MRRCLPFLLLLLVFPALKADSAALLFGRTQQAIQTPFEPLRNPGFGGGPSPFVSTDVQNAIEEALVQAVSNDRFLVLTEYNGNANVGRYLEFFSGINSEDAPLFNLNITKVIGIVCATTSVSSDASIGFFDLNVSDTVPLYTLTMDNLKRKIDSGSPSIPLFSIPTNGELGIRVTLNSINKPHCYIVFSSAI